jgi:MFS family permease
MAKNARPQEAQGFRATQIGQIRGNFGLVSSLTVATSAPWLLLSLPGGAIVDRVNRRALIITMQLVRGAAVAFLGVAIVLGLESVGLIYATAFLIILALAIYGVATEERIATSLAAKRADSPRSDPA